MHSIAYLNDAHQREILQIQLDHHVIDMMTTCDMITDLKFMQEKESNGEKRKHELELHRTQRECEEKINTNQREYERKIHEQQREYESKYNNFSREISELQRKLDSLQLTEMNHGMFDHLLLAFKIVVDQFRNPTKNLLGQ